MVGCLCVDTGSVKLFLYGELGAVDDLKEEEEGFLLKVGVRLTPYKQFSTSRYFLNIFNIFTIPLVVN